MTSPGVFAQRPRRLSVSVEGRAAHAGTHITKHQRDHPPREAGDGARTETDYARRDGECRTIAGHVSTACHTRPTPSWKCARSHRTFRPHAGSNFGPRTRRPSTTRQRKSADESLPWLAMRHDRLITYGPRQLRRFTCDSLRSRRLS